MCSMMASGGGQPRRPAIDTPRVSIAAVMPALRYTVLRSSQCNGDMATRRDLDLVRVATKTDLAVLASMT